MTLKLGLNIEGARAISQLSSASASKVSALQRLSTGQRINNASDDAASLAIAMSLQSGQRVFTQAVRNINDGISVLSVAEAAMGNLNSILGRQLELAEQSANGSFGAKQRSAIQEESNQLTAEFNRIIATTNFNHVNILDGSLSSISFHVGASSSVYDSISLSLGAGASTDVSMSGSSGRAEQDIFDFSNFGGVNQIFSFSVGALAGNDLNISISGGDYVAFGLTDQYGTNHNFYLFFTVDGSGTNPTDPGGPLEGVPFEDGISVNVLSSDSSSQIATKIVNSFNTIIGSGYGNATASYVDGLYGNQTSTITITSTYMGATTGMEASYSNSNSLITQAGSTLLPGSYLTFSTPQGDYYLWFNDGSGSDPGLSGKTGIEVNYNTSDSAGAIASAAQSKIQGELSNVTATVTASPYSVGLSVLNLLNGAVSAPSVAGISGTTSGVVRTTGTNSIVDTLANTLMFNSHGLETGQAITLSSTGTLPGGLAPSTTYYAIKIDSNTLKLATSLSNAFAGTAIDISNYGNGTINLAATKAATPGLNLSMQTIDLTTQVNARGSLDTVRTQLELLSTATGKIGAVGASLRTALNIAATTRENYAAAESRIVDADIAQETARVAATSIREEIITALLAQSRKNLGIVLSLL